MIILVLILTAVFLGYLYVKKQFSYFDKLGVKHLKPNLLFGNLVDNVFQRKAFAEVVQDQYNIFKNERYFGFYQFSAPILVINDPDLIKDITVKKFEYFTDHQNQSSGDVDQVWSRNVFSMKGEAWHNMRAILSPAFTGNKMRWMFPLINEVAEDFIKFFLKKEEQIITLEMKDTMTRLTNDMIASAAFGIRCDSLREPNNEFYSNGRNAFNFTGLRKLAFFMHGSMPTLAKLLGLKVFSDELSTFFRRVIKESIAMREEKGLIRQDMVHLLLQARKGQLVKEDEAVDEESFSSTKEYSKATSSSMKAALEITDDDITAQALIFFFAGFDTSSHLMSFIAYELAISPEIQTRLIEDVDNTFEDGKGKITYEGMVKMKYLDMVVSETLRKWPGIVLDRMCVKDFVIEPKSSNEKPIHLKPGAITWIPIYGIHRDPNIYPDPTKFDPERFNSENRAKIKACTYMPFGSGPRNCIGSRLALMEVKTSIANLLRNFEFVPVKETTIPLVLCKKRMNVAAEEGIWVGLKKR